MNTNETQVSSNTTTYNFVLFEENDALAVGGRLEAVTEAHAKGTLNFVPLTVLQFTRLPASEQLSPPAHMVFKVLSVDMDELTVTVEGNHRADGCAITGVWLRRGYGNDLRGVHLLSLLDLVELELPLDFKGVIPADLTPSYIRQAASGRAEYIRAKYIPTTLAPARIQPTLDGGSYIYAKADTGVEVRPETQMVTCADLPESVDSVRYFKEPGRFSVIQVDDKVVISTRENKTIVLSGLDVTGLGKDEVQELLANGVVVYTSVLILPLDRSREVVRDWFAKSDITVDLHGALYTPQRKCWVLAIDLPVVAVDDAAPIFDTKEIEVDPSYPECV